MIKQHGGIFGRHPEFSEVSSGAYAGTADLIVNETGTSRTLAADDNGKVLVCDNTSAITVTCPTGLPVGFSCTIIQANTGKVTLSASGSSVQSYSGLLSTMGQYAVISVISPDADSFIAAGNLGVA